VVRGAAVGRGPDRGDGVRWRAWLDLTRASNLPTVWSNVATGATIAAASGVVDVGAGTVAGVAAAGVSGSLLYCFGTAHNEVRDADRDLTVRAGKPIPSGRISKRAARASAYACLAAGVGIAALLSVQVLYAALLIGAFSALYNREHGSHATSVLWLGLCRGLLYGMGAFATGAEHVPELFWPAASLIGYTAHLTVLARAESRPGGRVRARSALALPLWGLLMLLSIGDGSLLVFVGLWVPFAGWVLAGVRTATSGATVSGVMAWIAGMCLLDAAVVAWAGEFWMVPFPVAMFVLTRHAQARVTGS